MSPRTLPVPVYVADMDVVRDRITRVRDLLAAVTAENARLRAQLAAVDHPTPVTDDTRASLADVIARTCGAIYDTAPAVDAALTLLHDRGHLTTPQAAQRAALNAQRITALEEERDDLHDALTTHEEHTTRGRATLAAVATALDYRDFDYTGLAAHARQVRTDLHLLRTQAHRDAAPGALTTTELNFTVRERDEARTALARIRNGADPTPAPDGILLTPAQAWHVLLNSTPTDRLERLTRMLKAAHDAHDCHAFDHQGRIADLTARLAVLTRLDNLHTALTPPAGPDLDA